MAWQKKKRGPATGYFYKSVRRPGEPYPSNVYYGRGAAGMAAAAEVEQRAINRRDACAAVQAELNTTAAADRMTAEVCEWADLLFAAWLVLTGHRNHKGNWRLKSGKTA